MPGLVRIIMVSEELAVVVEEPGRFRAARLVCGGVFCGYERPPCRQAGYYRHGRDYGAFRAADSQLMARFNLHYPVYVSGLSTSCSLEPEAMR